MAKEIGRIKVKINSDKLNYYTLKKARELINKSKKYSINK